ncbi:hypothetical protein [Halalkalicoccus sp. NIPERK01]|nr:hypothetical protein [Halalkalicoccus sp. NIPERK01]MDL5362148.1 hypothetical protein [Halalkalicoccus sp. NIPERK01]
MELTLILIAAVLLLGLVSPLAFAVFLFTRDREEEESASSTNA